MKRCNNWPAKLALFIEEKRNQPFDWAANNCCFFACDWLAILVGIDPAADMRADVTSSFSAQKALAVRGGVDTIATEACVEYGWPECPPSCARRGDVVEVQTEHGPALGVCVGAQSIFPGVNGIEFRDTLRALRAWRVC
jgi:hypothetical protein